MFANENFVPVFGRPYDQLNDETKGSIRKHLVDRCIHESRYWRTHLDEANRYQGKILAGFPEFKNALSYRDQEVQRTVQRTQKTNNDPISIPKDRIEVFYEKTWRVLTEKPETTFSWF